MKLDRLETHDRLIQFKKQSDYISKGCQDCINNRPQQFTMPFYIFAHTREVGLDERISLINDDIIRGQIDPLYIRMYKDMSEVPTARLIWSPRLTKPTPQQNSMLFKCYPEGDNIKVIWMLPAQEMWDGYTKGNMMQNQIVVESINMFKTDFATMSLPDVDDLPESKVNEIYADIAKETKKWEII